MHPLKSMPGRLDFATVAFFPKIDVLPRD